MRLISFHSDIQLIHKVQGLGCEHIQQGWGLGFRHVHSQGQRARAQTHWQLPRTFWVSEQAPLVCSVPGWSRLFPKMAEKITPISHALLQRPWKGRVIHPLLDSGLAPCLTLNKAKLRLGNLQASAPRGFAASIFFFFFLPSSHPATI